MECRPLDQDINIRKIKILETNGYKCIIILRNCMCKHVNFIPSQMRIEYLFNFS